MVASKGNKGLGSEKDEFSDWYSELLIKADIADYSSVSGCIVYKPEAYAIWEKIKEETDKRFKKIGIQNVYFPLFIPERTFDKLKEHTAGFSPEVAWVTHAGDTKLGERLAIRPTSETIMYESYAKWIRSWRDLPLKYNQWNNVVRWEFKHPVPFLRGREFLWNEGHTAYATKKEAQQEEDKIIGIYKDICEKYLALPSLIGRKSDKEKFAGAEYTVSMEFYMPNGKAVQGPDFHHDGQHFSKAYGIEFLNKNGEKEYAYQNTFAISTRMLGVMFAVHSDEKGLVLPPNVASRKVVIVPILFGKDDEKVLTKCRELEKKLSKFGAFVDDRAEYKPGNKFHEWELKGIPVRVEIGPRDVEKREVVISRRDTGEKQTGSMTKAADKIESLLEEIQNNLFEKAKKKLYDNIVEADNFDKANKALKDKKIVLAPLSRNKEVDEELKTKTGAKVLNIPYSQPPRIKELKCIISGKKADYFAYIGRSY